MSDWQPIETAPKDHFPRLVWSVATGQIVAFRDVSGRWWPCPAREALAEHQQPIFWMELPPSPFNVIREAKHRD